MELRVKDHGEQYDVIVAGAGPAGCAAAIASARNGAKTLLIEGGTAPGGMATLGLVSKWAPFTNKKELIYKGLPLEIVARYKERAGIPEEKWDWINIDPEALKVVYDEMLSEAGVHVLYQIHVVEVEKEGEEIKALIAATKEGLVRFAAKLFIDCTGDGDVAYFAGCPFEKGGEEGTLQPGSLCFIIAGADMSKKSQELQLNSNPKDGLWAKIRDEKKYPNIAKHFIPAIFGNSLVFANAGHLYKLDSTDYRSISEALVEGRAMAYDYLAALKEYLPEVFKDARLVETAPMVGVRESRRIMGDYVLTTEDYLERRSFDDEIGRNCYWMDCHGKRDSVKETSTGYAPGESHGIPFRCLLPKNTVNLLVAGRCISMERMALASLRVMPNCLVEGEAAGIGAALAAESGKAIRDVDVKEIQKRQN